MHTIQTSENKVEPVMQTRTAYYIRELIDRVLENRRLCIAILIVFVAIIAAYAFDVGKYIGAVAYLITH